jgi:hypothetical protein
MEDVYDLETEIAKEKERDRVGLKEINNLGTISDDKIEQVDKGVVINLWRTFSSIISEYLSLYNKENLKSNNPIIYRTALYPNKNLNGYEEEYLGTIEELDVWANIVEETAGKFEKMLGYAPTQEEVNDAFDSLKKIFLGLWII